MLVNRAFGSELIPVYRHLPPSTRR